MQLEFSENTHRNRNFLLDLSLVESRFDVEYYLPEHFELLELLHSSKYPLKRLKEISQRIVDGPFGSSVKSDDYVEKGIPFIRVKDVTSGNGSINTEDMVYISDEKHKQIIRSIVIPGDIVIAKTGATMGAASVVPDEIVEANIRGDLAAISVDDDRVAKYITNYINTDIGQRLFWRLNSGSTRGRVVIGNLKEYPVIMPDLRSITLFNKFILKAKEDKRKKIQESNDLYSSIDGYLLSELGLDMIKSDSGVNTTSFQVNISEISGSRIDPKYILRRDLLLKASSKYPKVQLKELLDDTPQYGANQEACDKTSEEDVRFIRITDIDETGKLKKNIWKTTDEPENKYLLKYNDILFARSGSVGKCYIHKETDSPAIFAGYLIRFSVDTTVIDPDFLFYYCNSSVYWYWVDFIQRPAVQSNINADEFKSLLIPLPELEVQKRIVNYISEIRNKAERIKDEAEKDFEKAISQFEDMLIGGIYE